MSQASLLFLGTGASTGIPVIGCSCTVCSSASDKDKRLRTSSLIRYEGKNYLIDVCPDIRQQALKFGLSRLDGLIVTHTHYDHIGGLEELRIFNFIQKMPIPCLVTQESLNDIKHLFYYLFAEKVEGQNYTSQYDFQILSNGKGAATIADLPLQYCSYYQGEMKVLGLRFGDLAYITDIKTYSDDIFSFLEGVNTLVVSALRFTPSHLHFTIDQAIDFCQRVKAKKSYFIHLSHEVEHSHVQSLLPEGIHLAYDGLEIPFHIENKT